MRFVHSHVGCLLLWKASEKSGKRCDEHEVNTRVTGKTHDNPHPCSWCMLRLSRLLCRLRKKEHVRATEQPPTTITRILLNATNIGLLISRHVSQALTFLGSTCHRAGRTTSTMQRPGLHKATQVDQCRLSGRPSHPLHQRPELFGQCPDMGHASRVYS